MGRAEGLELERGLRNKRELLGLPMPCMRICGDWPVMSLGTKRTEPLLLGSGSAKVLYDWQALQSIRRCVDVYKTLHSEVRQHLQVICHCHQWQAGEVRKVWGEHAAVIRKSGMRPKGGQKRKKLKHFHTTVVFLYLAPFIRSRTLCYQDIVSWVFWKLLHLICPNYNSILVCQQQDSWFHSVGEINIQASSRLFMVSLIEAKFTYNK